MTSRNRGLGGLFKGGYEEVKIVGESERTAFFNGEYLDSPNCRRSGRSAFHEGIRGHRTCKLHMVRAGQRIIEKCEGRPDSRTRQARGSARGCSRGYRKDRDPQWKKFDHAGVLEIH